MLCYVGCSGFSYSAWSNHFYPPDLPKSKWLSYYSKVFDYVEIDSSFYRTPSVLLTRRWANNTPDNFRFTAKMPQAVTHEKRLGEGAETSLKYFYDAMLPLKDKLLCVLLQLPPSFTKKEGFKKLKKLPLDTRFRHAVEVRHSSWYDGDVFDFFKKNDICFVWSQRDALSTPPVMTADFAYLRLIGDRSIQDIEFGKIQRDRNKEMQVWVTVIEKLEKFKNLKTAIVAANNHYAGFGAATANTFLEMVGLPQVTWYETGKKDEVKQTSMFDFDNKL
jgi:uncharacterized protein YecE (DUF72 family)